jgi:plastocyanin
MQKPTRPLGVLVAVAVLALAGCGDDGSGNGSDGAGTETTPAQSPTDEGTGDDDAGANGNGNGNGSDNTGDDNADDGGNDGNADDDGNDDAVEVEIEIEDGQTTPAGERITVAPGQTIELEVDSDTADELHVHANPEHAFTVKAAQDQTFEFAIDQPGVYEMESHETGAQIISIQVQP